MTDFFRHIAACNRFDMADFMPFSIGMKRMGWIARGIEGFLLSFDHLIQPQPDGEGVKLADDLTDYVKRSAALAVLAEALAKQSGKALRGELYPVISQWGDEPTAQIDRAAVPWFGFPAFGVHMNGFVRRADGIHLWIGERAHDRLIDPGKLDNIVGGGQPLGLSLEENLAKEAWEEAGIPAVLARQSKPAGSISYRCERQGGLRDDTLFIYDLEVMPDFAPRNTDGEVAAFHLMPLKEVAEIIRTTGRFKFNCTLVVMDFLLRYGLSS